MADPLSGHKNGHLAVELEFHHFKWCGMAVAHQVTNKAAVLTHFAGALAIAHPGGLHNGIVPAHGIHQPDKTFI